MEQLESSLAGPGLVLDDEALDRIDEIVPPGTDLVWTAEGGGWMPPAAEPGRSAAAVGRGPGGGGCGAPKTRPLNKKTE